MPRSPPDSFRRLRPRSASGGRRRSFARCRAGASILALALVAAFAGGGRLHAQAPFPQFTVLDLPGGPGTHYRGAAFEHALGRSLAEAGDTDGDRWPDLLIGLGREGEPEPGGAWLVRGGTRLPHEAMLPMLDGVSVRIRGDFGTPDRLGAFVAGAGDVDGDGLDDFLLGAPAPIGARYPEGAVFLVFGQPWPEPVISLGRALAIDGQRSVVALRTTTGGAFLGEVGAGAGDLDGDGFADLALGVPAAGLDVDAARGAAGRVHVILGGPHLRGGISTVDLDGPGAPPGFTLEGPSAGAELGAALAAAGDLDGDGLDDLAVGAPGLSLTGGAFLLFGRADLAASPPALAVPRAGDVARVEGSAPGASLGAALAGGRDATGDGRPDLLLGAPTLALDGRVVTGGAYLLPGNPALRELARVPLPQAAASLLRGLPASRAGASVALVPDVEGDDIAELLVGAPGAGFDTGAAFLVYGRPDLAGVIPLEQLNPLRAPLGAQFLHNVPRARLGAAVVGLEDRSGRKRGVPVIAAPDDDSGPNNRSGSVYEIRLSELAGAPRRLTCELLAGRRVVLRWMVPRPFREVRVWRNGRPITGPLPGDLLRFIDTRPPGGPSEYFVEGNGNAALRSDLCRVEVRPLPVRGLECRQVPGTTRVRLSWKPGDRYLALAVLVDGQPFGDLLPPDATKFEFDRGPGAFRVEVLDPLSDPEGMRAVCEIEVVKVEIPPVEDLRCTVLSGPDARLEWTPSPLYDAWEIRRNSIPIARLAAGGSYLDEDIPRGRVVYVVRGISSRVHAGASAMCVLDVPRPGLLVLRGSVVFADRCQTSIGRGRIIVQSGLGMAVAKTQLDESGKFAVEVPGRGPWTLRFEGELDAVDPFPAAGPAPGPADATGQAVSARLTGVEVGELAVIRVPIPALAVVAKSGIAERWKEFATRLDDRALLFARVVPNGVGPGALAIRAALEDVLAQLEAQLGAAPCDADLVAFGSAGLAARLYTHAQESRRIRRLILLGTPNLGTARALGEIKADIGARPLPGSLDGSDAEPFLAADEQTPDFLEQFNRRITSVRGAEVHLVAGTNGPPELDPVLGCAVHDGRVCEASALAAIPTARLHRIAERHDRLGRGALSLGLLVDDIGVGAADAFVMPRPGGMEGPPAAGGGARDEAASPAAAAPEGPEALGVLAADGGGGAADGGGYSSGSSYYGVLQSGDEGDLPFLSDTSGSIIVILHTEPPGGILFSIVTPSGETVDPAGAAGMGVDYLTYGDGEGRVIQSYGFPSAEVGTYTAHLENPEGGEPLEYGLEVYLDSDVLLVAALDPAEVEPASGSRVLATLVDGGAPLTGASVGARLHRPDGSLELLSLLDDGAGADETEGDGTYSAPIAPSDQAGFHTVEVTAEDGGAGAPFLRTAILQLLVRSDAAALGPAWSSGADDADLDGIYEQLWFEGELEIATPGSFLVTGRLEDLEGGWIADSGTLVDSFSSGTTPVRIGFDAEDIFASRSAGPYLLAQVEVIDLSVGFVRADFAEDVLQSDEMSWRQFGLLPDTAYVRGDATGDGSVDISDPIFSLLYLFAGGAELACLDAADTNGDGAIDVSDAIHELEFLFSGGSAIPEPFPACGRDALLGCDSHPPCAQ